MARSVHRVSQQVTRVLLVALLALAGIATAQEFPPDALRISYPETGESQVLTFEFLQSLPSVEIATTTPWTEGVQVFRGVPLAKVLELQATDRTLHMRAVNDYFITMPTAEVTDEYPVIAYMRNGVPMSVRDKGRYWLIYPFDSEPRFNDETHLSRSIWQLVEIKVFR